MGGIPRRLKARQRLVRVFRIHIQARRQVDRQAMPAVAVNALIAVVSWGFVLSVVACAVAQDAAGLVQGRGAQGSRAPDQIAGREMRHMRLPTVYE